MSCSKAHKTDNCTQNWLIVSSCFLVAAARALLVALFLCVCVPVRAHWPLEDKAGNAAARCQLPVASCQSRVQRSGKCNTTTRHGNSSTTSSDFNTLDIISGQMSLQYDRRVSSEVAADCRPPDRARHAHKCATLFSTHTERHIHLAFEPKLHCEIPCLDAPADRHRLGQLTCPSPLPPSPPRCGVSRPSIVGNICGSRRQCTLINSEALTLRTSFSCLTLAFLLALSRASSPSVSQSINWQAAWQSASRLSSCRLAAVN